MSEPHTYPAAFLEQALREATERHRSGNLAGARHWYEILLAQAPNHALAQFRKGLLDLQEGHTQAALVAIGQATAASPDDARFKFGLGQALQALERWDDAADAYETVLRLDPTLNEATGALAWCLQNGGHMSRAVAAYRLAVAAEPDNASHGINLAIALCQQRDFGGAEAVLRETLERHAESPEAWFNLGIALRGLGRGLDAANAYRRAAALRPEYIDALVNLGNVLSDMGEFAHAENAYDSALAARPDSIAAANNAACLLRVLGRLEEAEDALLRALKIDSHHAALHDNLGNVYKDAGALDQAIICFRKALELDPNLPATHSNLAYALSFQSQEAKPILDECKRWNSRFAAPLARWDTRYPNALRTDRRLRIGYVSADFREHCQSLFMAPLLSQHDHSAFEIFCYASVKRRDEFTRRAMGFADVWRDVVLLDDEAVSRRIRDDGIDILVDLTMHMSGGRPLVFARKPAPVQIAWLAYPGTTGIGAMDFRLSDPRLDPPGVQTGAVQMAYSERTIRLDETFWCYDPLSAGLDVNELPALTRGYVTVGCLNNPCKLSDHTLRLWSGVMRALPSARLLLLAPQGRHREHLKARLASSGIAAQRVDFTAFQPRAAYLRAYHGIDLGLDTFPYNGHTTSLDSLWMGVPVVTRVGDTCVGRGGSSQLYHLDLSGLAAHTDTAFIESAVDLAGDLDRLRALRAGLRARLERSPLMNAERFARAIEAAYRFAWEDYCKREITPTP